MKTRKVGEVSYTAAETGEKIITWETDYRASACEKGAVQVRTSTGSMVFTSEIEGVLGPTDSGVWASLTSVQNANYYHKDIPKVRYLRVKVNMTTNPDGGVVEAYVLE